MEDTTHNSNESINWSWIDESIASKRIRYFEYENFSNIKEIDSGGFGIVYRAKWKNSGQYFALKSFKSLDNAGVKELVREVFVCISFF
jgi:hypothetical protein